MSRLRLALPSKGMEDDTVRFLKSCGLSVDRPNQRQYRAQVRGLPSGPVEVVFQRPTDIFAEVNEGTVDLGITGFDVLSEERSEDDDVVVVHGELGFQRCALVLAVPEGWVDVTTISDLADVAAELRAGGHELRVATKYPNLTRQFLYERGISYFRLVELSGALEIAPQLDTADIICDLTSSGVTLRENRLKTLVGGTVVQSQACLIGNRRALRGDPARLEATRELLELVDAFLRAREHVSVTANIRGEDAEAVARQVNQAGEAVGLRGPTVARVFPREDDGAGSAAWFAVTLVVRESSLLPTVELLRRAGASEVSATQVRYIFHEQSSTFQALCRQLGVAAPGGASDRTKIAAVPSS